MENDKDNETSAPNHNTTEFRVHDMNFGKSAAPINISDGTTRNSSSATSPTPILDDEMASSETPPFSSATTSASIWQNSTDNLGNGSEFSSFGFWCRSHQICIENNRVCDGKDDCLDGGTDEQDCVISTTTTTTTTTSSTNEAEIFTTANSTDTMERELLDEGEMGEVVNDAETWRQASAETNTIVTGLAMVVESLNEVSMQKTADDPQVVPEADDESRISPSGSPNDLLVEMVTKAGTSQEENSGKPHDVVHSHGESNEIVDIRLEVCIKSVLVCR